MGKKWKRVSLADLASEAMQKEIMGSIDQAKGQPGVDSPDRCSCAECTCGKRRSESPTTGR